MRISAITGLSALVFCFQAVLAQPMDISLPPEDLDSSGDDDDSFSGSGAGPLIEHPVIALNVPVQESANTSLMPEVSTNLRDTQTKVQVIDSPVEDNSGAPVSTTNISGFPVTDLVSKEAPVVFGDKEVDSFIERETTKPTVLTTRVPIMHHISTVRITTSRAASTVRVIDDHDTHSISNIDKMPAVDIVPESEKNLNITTPSTVSSTVLMDSSPLPEKDIFSEDGSGDQGDFIFPQLDENLINVKDPEADNRAINTKAKDAKSEGAPQGLMDRKEVLGGVIAGGLVGLLFAGFLVGFMLYRMKKKDEGSYSLDEPKQSNGGYQKPHKQEEFYA
ncbi:syndecan-1 [Python bivittatus]|uniref:Syndecan n=1 Tax=Python bivittatus TaxID=176946 RepID=A0A9F2QW47_PYTBI|nr:syndecan-1 [Python bivittatus]